MKTVKRIETIVPEAVVQPLTTLIEKGHFQAYFVNSGLSGKNRQGLATAGLCDAVVTVICTPEEAEPLITEIRSFLAHYGGIGVVTEAQGLTIAKAKCRESAARAIVVRSPPACLPRKAASDAGAKVYPGP